MGAFKKYYLLSVIGVLLASAYPIYMAFSVAHDMVVHGTVYADTYPKYIIPYSPIALAVLVGVAIMPIIFKYVKKCATLVGTAVSTVVFFTAEFILESCVIVTSVHTSTLEAWQMAMCYVSTEDFPSRTWTEVNVLMGEYSPMFKMHFYIISVVIILSLLNCFYGFAKMIITGDRSRVRSLVMQSVTAVGFLAMCIWACFTAFYRDGDLLVSPLSATLMCVFFVLFGVTMGVFVGSFTVGRKKSLSIVLPSVTASLVTLIMYIGEMFLLSGHLYLLGNGFFFEPLGPLVLAPVDIVMILLSGALTALLIQLISQPQSKME
ncbi:MAG: hypothetical protein E7672_07030 [Ruminococcaceae bacterium]|nr:hypothetical protein [Oscillospiraceae bacterium]